MAGRKKEPIELIQAKGRKHLTKEEIKNRTLTQIVAPSDNIIPPDWLGEELKEIFSEYAIQLKEVGIISNLDVGALERYVVAEYEYREYSAQLLEMKVINAKYVKIRDIRSDALKEARALASDLGLTPSSRGKLVVPKAKEEKPKNKFEKFVK
ncbi:phage terminase small subunit P27 family [uncultured Clostridium sp.]|uniref:phage terminase small subunit P27 family n=1 Tax=uncultured Clostridium sp. TaxID=59620 RepID=UPI00260411A7|nr:phage terminase small subunit P27 family [uncultured Clostridium sp.]